MAVVIKSYEEILGAMIRKIVADTTVNDLNVGSVILTLLEAAAQVDFENSGSILNVLELLSIDAVQDNDLDARGADFGLTRIPARRSTGVVSFTDSNITKRSTTLFQVKPPPIAGQSQVFVNDASLFAPTGQIFIGRGTAQFEGPISYSSIVDNGTFYTINLSSALQKDHLISDVVVDAQGTTDRVILAGARVIIPANNQNPEIVFVTLRNATIPSGEDTITGVPIQALLAGSTGNAGINTITNFSSPPFTGATVTNPSALTDGVDVESDSVFRERIKAFTDTLARGTEQAILTSIIGISDAVENKQASSAVITEPPTIGDPSIVYLDDGSGFQPSFAGQSVDTLLSNASGNEEFLQLANFPLPRAQSINTVDGPYELVNNMQLRVLVDGTEETITFTTADFANISSATVAEVIIAINAQATNFRARFTSLSSRILLYPVAFDAETIEVAEIKATEDASLFANSIFKFPTNEFSHIKLYQNNTLLKEKKRAAVLVTNLFSTWGIAASGNLVLSVDGTPQQDGGFTIADFGGASFLTLDLNDWVAAFNAKFAGITATATASGAMQIVSNKEGSDSSLTIIGGTYFDTLFSGQDTTSAGQDSQFQLNRQTGNIRILTTIAANDSITAGTTDAKGQVISATTPTGNYNVAADPSGRPAEVIVVSDAADVAPRTNLGLAVGHALTITEPSANIMRIMSDSLTSFSAAQPFDYVHITPRTASWLAAGNTGVYKIIAKGGHTVAGTDSYIDVKNDTITAEGPITVLASEDIQIYSADEYPQLWKGTFTAVPTAAPIQNIIDSFLDNIINVESSTFKTNSVKVTTSTEEEGSIALPVSVGTATSLFASEGTEQKGNPSHVASRVADKDAISLFKRTEPTATDADGVSGKTVFLDRFTYSDLKGSLTSNAIPGTEGVDPHSEELESTGILTTALIDFDDYIVFTDSNNKSQYRAIREIEGTLPAATIGTRHSLPRTLLDHITGDKFSLVRPLSISSEDSIVFILDQDAVTKTIDIQMSRTGRINADVPPTTASFSADDADNEVGVTFGSLVFWGKAATETNTEFADYAVWFRARNWYVTGGDGVGVPGITRGAFIVRADEYGPHGENIRLTLDYPDVPDLDNNIAHTNNPENSTVTYLFGSGPARLTGIASTDEFTVSVISAPDKTFRYTFTNGADFSAVVPGDILSIKNDALGTTSTSVANSGRFRIEAVNDGANTLDIYNPDGLATLVGTPEITDIDTAGTSHEPGQPTIYTFTCTAEPGGGTKDGEYILLRDSGGLVAFWFDIDDSGTAEPAHGAARSVEINTILTGDSATTVAIKVAAAIDADSEFSCPVPGTSTITVTTTDDADYTAGIGAGTSDFGFANVQTGIVPNSLDGEYFILSDNAGTVAFWFDATGTTPEPIHGATRSVEIDDPALTGSQTDAQIATIVRTFVNNDAQFSAPVPGGTVVTVTDAANGARTDGTAETTPFTLNVTQQGVTDTPETIVAITSFNIFPLEEKAVSDIVTKISESPLLNAVAIGTDSLEIGHATREEVYTPAGPTDYTLSLALQHDPDATSGNHDHIKLFDGQTWVKTFTNSNPHFVTKTDLLLPGASTEAYDPSTTPNEGTTDLGEFFKLVPVTLTNVYHHLTHKALSQLQIVSEIDIASAIRRVQIKSKELGSAGAVEVVGGNANAVQFGVIGEVQDTTLNGKTFIEAKIARFPVTFTTGDLIRVENDTASKRLSRLGEDDRIDVVDVIANDNMEYHYNDKLINVQANTRWNVTDTSATYARPAGVIWRWEHNGGSVFDITEVTPGGVPASLPSDHQTATGADAQNLIVTVVDDGSTTTLNFQLELVGLPTDLDYFFFETGAGGDEYAIFFELVANISDPPVSVPTGAPFSGVPAPNRIRIPFLATDTEDDIMSRIEAVAGPIFTATGALFTGFQTLVTDLSDVVAGDLLHVHGDFPVTYTITCLTEAAMTDDDFFAMHEDPDSTIGIVYDAVNGAPSGPTATGEDTDITVTLSGAGTDTAEDVASKTAAAINLAAVAMTAISSGANVIVTTTFARDLPDATDAIKGVGGRATGFTFSTGSWDAGNLSNVAGDGEHPGFPIIAVNSALRYVDVINPFGTTMTNAPTNAGSVHINPTPIIKFPLLHSSKVEIDSLLGISVTAGIATVFCDDPHKLSAGDTVTIDDNATSALVEPPGPDAQPVTVLDVTSPTTFTFATGAADSTFIGGNLLETGRTRTRYKIEKFGFNNLFRLIHVDGDAPGFIDCGAAVDDFLILQGSTFKSNNTGRFRILSVDNSSIIFENSIGSEELNTINPFNNLAIPVTWAANSDVILGSEGDFKNLSLGDWVKKTDDPDTLFVQVIGFTLSGGGATTPPNDPGTAERVVLGSNYSGTTATTTGVSFDQVADVNKGVYLQRFDDIHIIEGDAVVIGDNLFVDDINDAAWFDSVNSGTFAIDIIGTHPSTYKPFLRVENSAGIAETNRLMSVNTLGMFIIEGANNKFKSIRKIEQLAVDDANSDQRTVYITPPVRSFKMSQANSTKFTALGKLGYSTDVVTGVDGYLYYTGLLRTAQRIIDGFEPDPVTFPGRRAIGGVIEILPPLPKRITVSIDVTTNEGVNLNEISNDIKSAVITYIDGLGVGDDVITAEITVAVMAITGVEALTINDPAPGVERIAVADDEKVFIEPDDISVA